MRIETVPDKKPAESKFKPFWVVYTHEKGPKIWHKVTGSSHSNNHTRCGKDFKVDEDRQSVSSGWTNPKAVRRNPPTVLKYNERLCGVCSRP